MSDGAVPGHFYSHKASSEPATASVTPFDTASLADSAAGASGPAAKARASASANVVEREAVVLSRPLPDRSGQTLTLSVVDMPVHRLLHEVAAMFSLSLLIDDSVRGHASLALEEVSLPQFLQLLARQVSLRWELVDHHLIVSEDSPRLQIYRVNYLNIARSMEGGVGLATEIGSINLNPEQVGGSQHSNNSRMQINSEAQQDFWLSLETTLSLLMAQQRDTDKDAFSINRTAGLISVIGREALHADVRQLLQALQSVVSRQVLIEATVAEVSLSDDYQAGVDWRLALAQGRLLARQTLHGAAPPRFNDGEVNAGAADSPGSIFTLGDSGRSSSIRAVVDLLEQFGEVAILSRPQIIAMNNQPAVLKVVDNRVYFSVEVETERDDGSDRSNTRTRIHTVPVGLVMNVIPFVSEAGTVMLSVRPSISRILGFVSDPGSPPGTTSQRSGVPEIQVRELESVLMVPDGQVVVVGGLMQQQTGSQQRAVPLLGKLPGLGALFRQRERSGRKTELLVFLKPTVLPALRQEPL